MQTHSEFFPAPSAHEIWIRNRIPRGTHYDPADDGPEVQVIREVRIGEAFDAILSEGERYHSLHVKHTRRDARKRTGGRNGLARKKKA